MKEKACWSKIFCLVSAILLSLLTACAPPAEEVTSSPIEITDQLGRLVKLERIPQKIISLAPGNTEITFALDLADKVVAVTDYCDYPPEAKEKPSIGGFSTPNIEEIVALSPDLILAASIHEAKIIPQLEQKGITVFALSPQTLDEVLEAVTLVGEVSGNKNEAAALVTEMQERIKTVTDRTDSMSQQQRPRVFYTVWHDPLKTAGSGTLQDELMQKAGGINIAGNLHDYADISLEALIEANPEIMIAGVSHGSGKSLTMQFIETEPRLRNTDARRDSRVYEIDGNLTSRPGPRIVDGLENLAEFIHPELFGSAR
ncbi:ABC transporter substrate-binding protein [Chloroflexota bacterium]